jgi:hypothetical protein
MILNKYVRTLRGKMVVTNDEHECMFCMKKIPQDTPAFAVTVIQVPRGRIASGHICNREECSGLTPKVYAEMQKVLGYSTEFKHGKH